MCTLHLFFKCFPEAPVILAANRDELVTRPWEPPAFLSKFPPVFGPRDTASNGTWCAVNGAGVVAALANHEGTLGSGGSLCSRGFVVKEALGHGSAREAMEFARAIAPACKEYTLLLADAGEAFVVESARGKARVHTLGEGVHVVTNKLFDEPGDEKARLCLEAMGALSKTGEKPPASAFINLLSRHGSFGEALCVHDDGSGFATTSSSIIQIGPDGALLSYLFCEGPPCGGKFVETLSPF